MKRLAKLDDIDDILRIGGEIRALKAAAKVPKVLGDARDAVTKGWAAHINPKFYTELGCDPAALVSSGVRALLALLSATRPVT